MDNSVYNLQIFIEKIGKELYEFKNYTNNI